MEKLIGMKNKSLGIILSYMLTVIDIIVAIFFVPFLLSSLGDNEYGLYRLMLSTASYLSVLDFGIGGTITRYVVKYKVEKNKEKEENFVAMGLVIYAVLSVFIVILAVIISIFIPRIYASSIPPENTYKAQFMFLILCSTTALSLFNHAYNGLITAYEKFIFMRVSNILKIVLRILLIVAGITLIKSALVIAIVDFSLSVLLLICNIFYSKLVLKFHVKLHKWNWNLAKEALLFTSAILIQAVINQFNTNVDNAALGVFTSTATVAMYSLALQVYTMYSTISTSVSSVYLPSISSSVFEGKSDREITKKVVVPSRLQLIMLLLALVGFIIFGNQFISVWVGNKYNGLYALICILLISSTLELSQNSITSVLKAKNKMHGMVAILSISTLYNAVLTFILVPKFGAIGAVMGTAFSMVFGYGIALNIYYSKAIHLDMKLYYKETYKGILPAAIISIIPGIAIRHFIKIGGWSGFIISCGIFAIIYCALMLAIGLNKDEKQLIYKVLNKLKTNNF